MSFQTRRCLACDKGSYFLTDRFNVCQFCGLISAVDRKTTQVYNAAYVAERYDKYATTGQMSELRYQIMMGVLNLDEAIPNGRAMASRGTLLDIGYGNGSFIRCATSHGWDCYGNDVNPQSYPGVRPVELPVASEPSFYVDCERYKVVSFFDTLEHFEELAEPSRVAMNADYILLSYPKYPGWFLNTPDYWKHCRPGEHHHFFTPDSLKYLFSGIGYQAQIAYVGYPEDSIRQKLTDGSDNIETVMLRIRHE